MNLFRKYYYLIPLLFIFFQIFFLQKYNLYSRLTPISPKNDFMDQISSYLNSAKLSPQKVILRDYQSEVEFYLPNSDGTNFTVIFSTQKSPLAQVTALQKLIEIATIKGTNIKFIDLSSTRPYATL